MFFQSKFSPEKIRNDFPILKKGIIYFDNACMSLKPKEVIDKMNEYYNEYGSCAGRSAHTLAKKTELEVERAREEIRKFIGAKYSQEIIFTRNTTEGINLVSQSIDFKNGDEIILSDKEHNSNLVPWLKLRTKGVKIVISNTNQDGIFNIGNFKKCFTKKTKLVSVVHVSNLDGVTFPIEEIIEIAHEKNVPVLIDGAQSFPHRKIDVRALDADFFAFSGHKALGPTGTGVLYGKKALLEKMSPFLVGGHMVSNSTYEDYEPAQLPDKFEAGLHDYAGIIGLGQACKYLKKIGMENIEKHELKLNKLLTSELSSERKIKILGPPEAEKRSGIFTFIIEGMNSHDVAKMLDSSKNIAVRSGAFCVHSWFNARKIEHGAIRASVYFYNTEEEIKIFAQEIKKILKFN